MNVIIDNEKGRKLSEVFLEEIKNYNADTWRFATGFFFFDGWKYIRQSIPDSLNKFYLIFGYTDEMIAKLIAENIIEDQELIKILTKKLVKKLSDDVLKELDEDRTFKSLAESNKFEIRWLKNLHAKLYLFTKNEKDRINFEGRAIVGSSNITGRGFDKPGELNVFISDVREISILLDWFKRRWNEALEVSPHILLDAIVEENGRRKMLKSNKFVDSESFGLTLFEAYLFLIWYFLNGMYDLEKVKTELGWQEEPKLFPHNEDPVIWGYHIIKEYNGVILADPVGLGKSFQALGILASLRIRDGVKNALFVLPPHLISNGQWEDYIKEFFPFLRSYEDNYIKNYGISTHKVIKCSGPNGMWEILLISSYGLALLDENNKLFEKLSDYDVLVIDEAHHFKNIHAKKRKILNKIIQLHREKYGKNPYSILLTATPILNDVSELLSLVSIYTQGEGFFDEIIKKDPEKRILKIFEEYDRVLRELEKVEEGPKYRRLLERKDELLNNIRDFVKKIMIMRSRSFIEKRYFGGERPKPKLKVVEVELNQEKELEELIDRLTLRYLDFSPTGFVVLPHVRVDAKGNKLKQEPLGISLPAVIKILLAKRLESSPYAFLKTLDKIRNKTRKLYEVLKNLNKTNKKSVVKEILKITGDIREGKDEKLGEYLDGESIPEIFTLSKAEKIFEKIEEMLRNRHELEKVKNDLLKDYNLLNEILSSEDLFSLAGKYTTKEEKLFELLDSMKNQNKRVVIFSMFKDTVDYLYVRLKERYGEEVVYKITGETEKKRAVIESFREPEDSFGVLVATDSISEGINLEFVDYLINYDIPWTPAIIMQRVGRLWRISRKSTKEYLFFNFIPPEGLVLKYSSILGRIEEKIKLVRDILILEIKLLKEEDELSEDFEERIYGEVLRENRLDDVREILSSIREGRVEQDFTSYLYSLLEQSVRGKKVKKLIRELERKFDKIKREIERGKTLNLATDPEKAVKVFLFNKRYWMKGNIIINDEKEKILLFQNKWEKVLKDPYSDVKWSWIKDAEDFRKMEETRFRNRLKRLIHSTYDKFGSRLDSELLSVLLQEPLNRYLGGDEDEELLELREKVFFTIFYFLENKREGGVKASRLGSEMRKFLREIGVIEGQKVNKEKLSDINTLRMILDKFEALTRDIRLEVIF